MRNTYSFYQMYTLIFISIVYNFRICEKKFNESKNQNTHAADAHQMWNYQKLSSKIYLPSR